MKKRHFILPTLAAVLSIGALALASHKQNLAPAKATGGNVAVDIWEGGWNPFGWGTKGLSNAGLTDTVTANNEVNMWGSDFLDLSMHDNIEFEVSFSAYDEVDTNIGNNTDGLDIYIKSTDNNTVYAIFRVWSTAWGAHNGTHSTKLWAGNWGYAAEGDSAFDSAGGGHTSVIKGDATSASSFKFRINRTHGFEFFNCWDSWSYSNVPEVNETILGYLNASDRFSIVFGADGGFSRGVTVTLKSYNGQSFANDGVNFIDDVAPELINAGDDNVAKYEDVTFGATAWDVFSGNRTVHYYESAEELDVEHYFVTQGVHTVRASASDDVGNEAEHEMSYTVYAPVASTFASWLMKTHTDTCAEHYTEAKLGYSELSAAEKTEFQENGAYADARERYENWCAANGDTDPYSGLAPSPAKGSILAIKQTTTIIVIATVSFVVMALGLTILVLKRRKHE